MDLLRLGRFVAVCDAGSLTAAARTLHVAQQSLSALVAGLEAELGVRLLERGRFGVRTTAAGRVLRDGAARLLADADGLTRAVQQAGELGGGEVSIRYGLDTEHLVEPLMTRVRVRADGLALTGWTAPDVDNLAAVRDGAVDLAFAWALPDRAPGLRSAVVAQESCLAAVPVDDPLAGHDAVSAGSLGGRSLVMFPRAAAPTAFDRIVDHLAPGGPGSPRVVEAAVSGQAGMVDLAVRTGGVAPVSEGLVPLLRRTDVAILPLRPPLRIPLHLVWRPGGGPAAARVVAILTHPVVDAAGPRES